MSNKTLSEKYLQWLADNIQERKLDNGFIELSFPFLDNDNDHIQLYAKNISNGKYLLSDDYYLSGQMYDDQKERAQRLIRATALQYQISVADDMELRSVCDGETLPQSIQNFVECLISANRFLSILRSMQFITAGGDFCGN